MEVIPAIDLRGGKCVRLYQGDYGRETVYSANPLDVASHWVGLGAGRLHVVDLDGARNGYPAHLDVVGGIASSASVPLQLGGGIRTVETARAVRALGVDRVIVGTAAVESPESIEQMCVEFGAQAVVVGVDARDGFVAVDGWTRNSQIPAPDLFRRMADIGVVRFLYTDISRDGTLTEPNYNAIENVVKQTGARLIAAGGISSVEHLLRLADIGVDAAVVGKALYTGAMDLAEALDALHEGAGETDPDRRNKETTP